MASICLLEQHHPSCVHLLSPRLQVKYARYPPKEFGLRDGEIQEWVHPNSSSFESLPNLTTPWHPILPQNVEHFFLGSLVLDVSLSVLLCIEATKFKLPVTVSFANFL
jgi:hypothetical protein